MQGWYMKDKLCTFNSSPPSATCIGRQAIILISAGSSSIRSLGTSFSEILFKIPQGEMG